MRTLETGVIGAGWAAPAPEAKRGRLRRWIGIPRQCAALVATEIIRLRRDPTDLLTRAVQPALWLVIFGSVFSRLRAIPTGNVGYLDFMTPGILAQSVLFLAIFYGIGVIWERDLGVLQKLLASPAPRVALVLGKSLSAGVRAVVQTSLIYVLAWLLGVHLNLCPSALVGIAVAVVLGATVFSTLSLIVACLVKSRERFMGIGQLLTMPLFFASNAIYPIQIMPAWLRGIARINPLTYEVDALRSMMIVGGTSQFGIGIDGVVLVGSVIFLTALCARLYPSLAR